MALQKNRLKLVTTILSLAFVTMVTLLITNNNETSNLNAASESAKVFSIETVTAGSDSKVADFTFKDGGKTVKFSELTKGKVVFLNFWGTWCPPCRKELPDIARISKEMGGKDFVVIGIALERGDDVAENIKKVADFSAKNDLGYINFIDSKRELQKVYGGIRAVPTTFIIDKNGKIGLAHEGMDSYDGFMAKINKVKK
jgi:thiol-disulfide isomerase/thioredoxin